jgi:hypothetical protein
VNRALPPQRTGPVAVKPGPRVRNLLGG